MRSVWRRLCGGVLLVGVSLTLSAQTEPDVHDEIERRLTEIAEVHVSAPWQESQRMIDALRPSMTDATLDQQARLDLMEARNRMLANRHGEGIELCERVLSRPVTPERRGRALELAANASLYLQNYGDAFEYLAQGLRLSDRIDDFGIRQGLLSVAARMHIDVGESSLALQYAAENRALAERSGDPRAICDAWITLVEAQSTAGFVPFAMENTSRLWEVCQQADDPVLFGGALLLIGQTHLEAGDAREAIGWLQRARRINREASFTAGVQQSEMLLGRSLVAVGETERGRSLLEPLAVAFESQDQWGDAHQVYLSLADAAHAEGADATALDHLASATDAWNRLNDAARARRLAYLQADFEVQRQRQELELLRRQNRLDRLQETNAEARRTTRMLGGVTAGVIGLLLLALLIRFRVDRRRYRALAQVDGLTGVYNHRQFHERVERGMSEAGRQRKPCSLVAADVDLFKQINDRYGHRAGDEVLRQLGSLLRERFPAPCVVGRVGGEEFAIFLPGHNRLQARQRVRAFQEALRPVTFEGATIEFTLSFGLVESRSSRVRLEKLRSAADRALYRAKRGGRNQLVDASDLPGEPAV